jgi:hypothetical protein
VERRSSAKGVKINAFMKKLNPLRDIFAKDFQVWKRFNLWILLPMKKNFKFQPVRDYFGEQITLYYMFMSFFNRQVLIISLFGVAVFGLQLFGKNLQDEDRAAPSMIDKIGIWASWGFTLFANWWLSYFLGNWIIREDEYALKFGTSDIEEVKPQTLRRGYRLETVYRRSVIDDNMNDQGVIQWKVWLYYGLSVMLIIFIFLVSFGISIPLFQIKSDWVGIVHENDDRFFDILHYKQIVINSIEWAKVTVLNQAVRWLAKELTEWQN